MKLPSFLFGDTFDALHKFESLEINEKSIVFYAENKASMNHFKPLIFELTEHMNLHVCYVTSVKDDSMLSLQNNKIQSFYIGDGSARTKFFLTLKSRILIMDMPDLEQFHIKRSKVYPVHYIYLFHSMFSVHSYLRKGAMDHYDTIFCVGPHHINEIRQTEKVYGLVAKELIPYGFARLDTLMKERNQNYKNNSSEKLVLIAPSYGEHNLLLECGIELIDILLKNNFKVLLRPHFKIFKDTPELIETIVNKFDTNPNFILERGILSTDSFNSSVCMISDWSGISLEYAFTFERPVIFIDVPKKILNPNFSDILLNPIEISIRHELGFVVSPNQLENIPNLINVSNENNEVLKEKIKLIRSKTVFNIGESAMIGAKFIDQLNNKLRST